MRNVLRGTKSVGIFGALYILAFFSIWAGLVGTFDYLVLHGMQRQSAAMAFPTVEGRVTESLVRVTRGSKGRINYAPLIRYVYNVRGKAYTSNVLRYGMGGQGGRPNAEQMVSARPVGSPVTMHYNPANPADAILEPGVHGTDLLIPLILFPFNLLVAG